MPEDSLEYILDEEILDHEFSRAIYKCLRLDSSVNEEITRCALLLYAMCCHHVPEGNIIRQFIQNFPNSAYARQFFNRRNRLELALRNGTADAIQATIQRLPYNVVLDFYTLVHKKWVHLFHQYALMSNQYQTRMKNREKSELWANCLASANCAPPIRDLNPRVRCIVPIENETSAGTGTQEQQSPNKTNDGGTPHPKQQNKTREGFYFFCQALLWMLGNAQNSEDPNQKQLEDAFNKTLRDHGCWAALDPLEEKNKEIGSDNGKKQQQTTRVPKQ